MAVSSGTTGWPKGADRRNNKGNAPGGAGPDGHVHGHLAVGHRVQLASTRSNDLPQRNQYVSQATVVSPKIGVPIHNAHLVGRATARPTMTRIPTMGQRADEKGQVEWTHAPTLVTSMARIAADPDVP